MLTDSPLSHCCQLTGLQWRDVCEGCAEHGVGHRRSFTPPLLEPRPPASFRGTARSAEGGEVGRDSHVGEKRWCSETLNMHNSSVNDGLSIGPSYGERHFSLKSSEVVIVPLRRSQSRVTSLGDRDIGLR